MRGVTSDDDLAAMREHLATGCGRCRRAADSMRRLLELAEADAGDTPPAFAKRSVKALFSLQQPERRSRLARLSLRLGADSGPVPAGVRAGQISGQPAHYESDEYSLDLRLDVPAGGGEAVLSGQLLRQRGEPVADTAAYLVSGGRVAAGCFTGDLGDFQIAVDRPESPELWLLPDGGKAITVSLGPDSAGPS